MAGWFTFLGTVTRTANTSRVLVRGIEHADITGEALAISWFTILRQGQKVAAGPNSLGATIVG
jgi:hypothetical protein